MAKNVSTRSSSFGAVASSSKDNELVSTSPILDTSKVRRKGKLLTKRRAVSDSAFSPGLKKLTEGQDSCPFSNIMETTRKLDHLSSDKKFVQDRKCDALCNAVNQCKNCSADGSDDRESNFFTKNLANRLRDLKRNKKPTTRISDLEDAQITDEEFVQSVRILDKVCASASPKKLPQNPANRLGLLPFVEVERSRLSQHQQRNSLPVSHLSLDEDKEEDGDMFADKDSAEAVEDLEEFTPWEYNSAKTSPLSFHGFSSQEYKSSREIAEESSQALNFEKTDVFFLGFSTADQKESEDRLEKWKSDHENLKYTRDEVGFLSTFEGKITETSAEGGKEQIPEIDSTENVFFNYKLKRKRTPQNLSQTENRCKKKVTSIAELRNEKFSSDCGKTQEARELITKAKVLPFPRINYMDEKLKNDSNAGFSNSRSKIGFSTAAGRPIKLSETAIAKAKLLLSEEIESINDDLMGNFGLNNSEDSRSECGDLNADRFSICGSKTNEGKFGEKSDEKSGENSEPKSGPKLEVKVEEKLEVKTAAVSEIESIEDDLFDELDNIIHSGKKSELTKAEENDKGQKDELLNNNLDAATVSHIACGFSTAAGLPIRVSKSSLEKAKASLGKELEGIENKALDEIDDTLDSESKSGSTTAGEKNERPKYELLNHKLHTSSDPSSSSGFSTARGIPIVVSKTALEKAEALFFQEIGNIEDELSDELDNIIDSGKKSELTKAGENDKGQKDELSNNNLDAATVSHVACGFSTAAGLPIRVSKTSLEKAEASLGKELEGIKDEALDEIDDILDSESKSESTTAGEKNEGQNNELLNHKLHISSDPSSSSGFSTARGIPIVVSKTALERAEALFSQEIGNIEDELFNGSDPATDSESQCVAQTAISKSETFSKEIAKTSPKNKTKSLENDSKINFGFCTAGGRELKVSEKSWAKSKAIFDSTEKLSYPESAAPKIESEFPLNKDSKINFGISTAGERELAVSEKSCANSKAAFDTIEEQCDTELAKMTANPELPLEKVSKINFGFSTAGGRELKVSKKSWANSKAVFDTIEEQCDTELAKTTANPELPLEKASKINFGFSTAGGRELKVSKKSWANSKVVFDTIKDQYGTELAKTTANPELQMEEDSRINFGFSTAGGRELKVSKKSWTNSKAVFDTMDEQCDAELAKIPSKPELPLEKDSKTNFCFSTAGERASKVSEKSCGRSKAVFDTMEEPCNAELAKTITNPEFSLNKDSKISFGFSTAGGRELKISEKSWAKSKALYDSIDESCIPQLAKTNTPNAKILASTTKSKTLISAISTTDAQSTDVPKKAVSSFQHQPFSVLDNMETLDFDDFVDPVEESEITKKRKLEEVDEETPLRREPSLKKKRGRYVSDLQARKLFIEDTNGEDQAEMTEKSSEKTLITEEIDAIAAALLEDEERSNEGTTWKIDGLRSTRSISPELGCEIANRTSGDVSIKNSFGIFNHTELKKVKASEEKGNQSCFHAASSGSTSETEENNHRAAGTEKREEFPHESIPDDLTFDSQFSQDIERSPVIHKFIVDAMKIMEGRLAVALKQDEAIRGKRRIKIEQSDGFLYRLRNENKESRTSWNELTNGIAPSRREIARDSSGRDVASVTADSAVNYSFRCADFYGEMDVRENIEGIKVGDGAFLVLDEKNSAGAREFERAFLASPGVDPNLVPTGWVRNHYRWIVWKLASMDRVKFGHKCLPRMLTPNRVMLELKYRYDREMYRIQWPPLRRILERGEDASARLVLSVSRIIEEKDPSTTTYKMEVTDGWYSIWTSIDAAMINFIKSGKVREGTKLMIFGAKAVNLDQGCSVLEIPEAVTLRICSNSTRRAKWNTKLDFYHSNRGPMSLSLKSVKPNGGAICKLVVAVSRVYPVLYREKLPDGQFVFRNARCDEEAARAHEARYQAKMEEIYANALSEFQIGSMNRKRISAPKNQSYTQEEAAACGRDMEEELRQKVSSKMSECLPTPRDVTPVMKIRIADRGTCALVTVWSTDRDTSELFVEGSSIAIYNAFASGFRSNELQITAGRSTFVKREISRRISYPERIYTSLSDITESGFHPVYGEFDTIGIVASTGPAPHGMKNFETVNLACPKSEGADASDFLSVLFWLGVSAHGYAKILTVGSLVACSNLEWRRNTSRGIPTAYCTERSIFSKNPRQNHLVQAFETLRKDIKEPQVYAAACATVIQAEIAKKSALRTPGNYGTPYKPATSNNRTPGWSPRDLTIETNCTTPTIDSQKISTKKRLEKLEIYGEPPKLPSIVINNSPRMVSSDFRSPVLTPVTKS